MSKEETDQKSHRLELLRAAASWQWLVDGVAGLKCEDDRRLGAG